jgi:hypothetical protein
MYKHWGSVTNSFRLAALGAMTGISNGITIAVPDGGDYHVPSQGNADVTSARVQALMNAHIVVFWKFIVSKGLTDRVFLEAHNEFTRTAYNNEILAGGNGITINDSSKTTFDAYGTDH